MPTMSKSMTQPVFTSQDLAEMYGVSADVTRQLIDRIGLGTRLGRWRIVQPSELERFEAGLLAMGYQIPPATEQPVTGEEPPAQEDVS